MMEIQIAEAPRSIKGLDFFVLKGGRYSIARAVEYIMPFDGRFYSFFCIEND